MFTPYRQYFSHISASMIKMDDLDIYLSWNYWNYLNSRCIPVYICLKSSIYMYLELVYRQMYRYLNQTFRQNKWKNCKYNSFLSCVCFLVFYLFYFSAFFLFVSNHNFLPSVSSYLTVRFRVHRFPSQINSFEN